MRKLVQYLLAVGMVLVMALPCFAVEVSVNGEQKQFSQFPSPYTIQVVDRNNQPVTNLYVYDQEPDTIRLSYDYASEQRSGFTDLEGKVILSLASDSYPCFVKLINGEDSIVEEFHISELPQKDGVYQLVWEHDSPSEYGNKARSGLRLFVMEEYGSDPVAGMTVLFYRKDNQTQTWHQVEDMGGYTDKDGYFYYLPELNGTELRMKLIEYTRWVVYRRDYTITPQPGKQNCYKIVW